MAVKFAGDLEKAGFIPFWLHNGIGMGAVEQISSNYGHGGGWRDSDGFTMDDESSLLYPGDPPMKVRAVGHVDQERVLIYDYGYVAVVQPDGTFQAARID